MEWIMDNIYIVAGILFFIVSSLGRLGKGGEEKKPARMPSFGGGDDRPGEPDRRNEPPTVTSEPRRSASSSRSEDWADEDETEYAHEPSYTELDEGYGRAREAESRQESHSERLDPEVISERMEARKQQMQKELEGTYAHLDRNSSTRQTRSNGETSPVGGGSGLSRSKLAEQAVQGVIWSEILGPPRSRRPMGRKR
ncbi:hypothetical protein XI25_25870 [Paenibacillus sp. DMB20]|nr:hypothetical protein XI25_25870 [Paenibacillus sp. DMB20]